MLLVLDVAFRNMGCVVMHKGNPVKWGTIITKKDKRRNIKVSDDYASNCAQLAERLHRLIEAYPIKGILGELPGGSQSAVSAKLGGGATGIVAAVAACHGLPIEWISEGDSKKAALGKRSAKKEEAMDWARNTYPYCNFGTVKRKFEHVADALMAYNGLRNGLLVRTFG